MFTEIAFQPDIPENTEAITYLRRLILYRIWGIISICHGKVYKNLRANKSSDTFPEIFLAWNNSVIFWFLNFLNYFWTGLPVQA